MTIYRIKSAVLKTERGKFETTDHANALRRLAELQVRDPQAKLLVLRPGGR